MMHAKMQEGILISYSILNYDDVESAPALFSIIFLTAAKLYMASW